MLVDKIQQTLEDPYAFDLVRLASSKHQHITTVAKAHPYKNRYHNVLASDAYRFKSSKIDYINASCIGTRYILTQGPLKATIADFWSMVIESKSNIIVCLTEQMENGNIKYDPYFNDKHSIYCSNLEINVKNIATNGKITVREINLIQKLHITQIQHITYHNWPDNDVPESNEHILAIINYIDNFTGPIIIHCSAGIGRTGAFVLMHYVLNQIKSNEIDNTWSVDSTLVKLRTYRKGLVQTDKQYRFILKWLLWYIKSH